MIGMAMPPLVRSVQDINHKGDKAHKKKFLFAEPPQKIKKRKLPENKTGHSMRVARLETAANEQRKSLTGGLGEKLAGFDRR
jgi:hypothetical protein